MTRPRDPHKPSDPLLPKIDDAPGPMPPLSAAEADAIAWGAVSRWAARPPGLEPVDDGTGPSQPLQASDADRIARQVLRVHAQRGMTRKLQPWALRAAAAALCLCGIAGVAFAAYRLWPAPLDTSTRAQPPAAHSSMPPAAAATTPSRKLAPPDAAASNVQPSPPIKPASPSLGPEELLARANALRAQRRWLAAETGYRKVLSAGASEPQRYVALVAAASIALQHLEKPARALSQYQAALALIPEGNLSEEILFGLAECQRALANANAERAALQQLSEEYPNGLFTAAAKRRQAQLEASNLQSQ